MVSDLNDDMAREVISVDVDERDEAMENDANAPPPPDDDDDDDAVPHSNDEEGLTSSEGGDTSASAEPGGDNLEDKFTTPEIEIIGSEDDDSVHHTKAGDPPINTTDDETTADDDDEKVIIVPNFVGDPIILHVPSKQAKSKPKDDVLSDDVLSNQVIEVVSDDTQMITQKVTESEQSASSVPLDNTRVGMQDVVSDHEMHLNGRDAVVLESTAPATNDGTVEETAPTSSTDNKTMSAESKESEVSGADKAEQKQIKLVDYASKLAGAQVLEHPPSFKGASNLLTGDKDKYSIAPCEDKKYVVIGLSEDILVKKIKLSNYERYSSRVKKFEVLASQEYPTPTEEHWNSIGTYEAQSKSGEQVFELENPTWARYLQFRFLSHYGSEHYCTLSQIKVHGSTMLQGFHEQWVESEKKDLELEQVDDDTVELREESMGEEDVESEDISLDDEEDQSQDMTKEIVHDVGVAGNIKAENDFIEEQPMGEDGHDRQMGDSLDEKDMNQQYESENEVVLEQEPIEEGTGTEGSNRSPQEPMTGEIEKSESSDVETSIIRETVHGGNISPPETNVGVHTPENAGGSDPNYSEEAERVPIVLNESHASGAIKGDDSESIPIGDGDIPPDEVKDLVNARQTGNADDGHSSIIAVTDVVKTVVADASDVIKNATRGTIKKAKDAILTSVTSTKMGSSVLDSINATAGEELVEHREEEVELQGKSQQLAKSNETSSDVTARDNVKPKAENASMIAGSVVEDSKIERGSTISKIESKATAGRDLLKRARGKETEATNRFATLSRRFPHAKCLKDLEFQTFKAKTSLAGTGGSLGGGMEPIFTKISTEIKHTQHFYEQYTTALTACYESLIWDAANNLDTMQASFDQILSRLERVEKEKSHPNLPSNLFAFIPAAFQQGITFEVPEQSTVLWASTLAIFLFLLLVRSFGRSKRVRDRDQKNVVDNQDVSSGTKDCSHNVTAVKYGEGDVLKPDTNAIPGLVSDLLAKELVNSKTQLTEKDEKLRYLQKEHVSLQERYSQLEQTISALESKIEQLTPAKDMHATRNGYTTPPPTVHCEPLSSGIMTISPTDELIPKEQEHRKIHEGIDDR